MGYINASKIAQYPPNLNRYQHVDDDSSVLWLEKAQSGKVSMEDIKDALAEFIKLFKAGMASKAETLTLARAFPDSPAYTEAARKQSEKDDHEPVVIGGPASVSLVDREGHLITTGALERAFKKFMDNDRTRNVMVLHSDVQVGWALPAYISKGGQIFKSGVNDNGLFFICELRDDTSISQKVSEQIHKGMLKSYSIAGSATKIQNMTKGLVPYLQVDDMELAEVTICEKGVNQGAGFELLKAELPPPDKALGVKLVRKPDPKDDWAESDNPPGWEKKVPPTRKMIMHSNDNGTINFNKSFSSWMKKEHKDPLTTKESFVTLNNEAGRKAEHEQLMREYGFPSEQSFETMRYVPVVETETDDDGIPIHNLPPWVVNEAGEALGDRLDEDAPDYNKSAKAKARQKAGSAQKMFYNFMGIEKAMEIEKIKLPWKRDKKAPPAKGRPVRPEPTVRPSGQSGFSPRGDEIAREASDARRRDAAIRNRKGSAIGQDTPDPTPKDYSRGTPTGFTPGEGGRAEREASGELTPQDYGRGTPTDFTPGEGREKPPEKPVKTGKFGAPKAGPGDDYRKERAQRYLTGRKLRNPERTKMHQEFKAGAKKVGGVLGRMGRNVAQGARDFRSGATGTTPVEGRNVAPGAEPVGKRGGISEGLGRILRGGAGAVKSGAGAAKRGVQAGTAQRQRVIDRVDAATADKPEQPEAATGGEEQAPQQDSAVSQLAQTTRQPKPEGRGFMGRAGARRDKEQAANQQMRTEQHHRDLGIGEGRIFSHPDFHGQDHTQQRAQVRQSMMNRGDKTLEEHLKNYQHLVGNYPSSDENGEAGEKIGHVTVNSLPEGHHAGTSMNNNEFHKLIQDGHVGFEPTPKYANANWQDHKAHVDSHIRDASHIAPAIEGAAPQTQIPKEGAAAAPGANVPPAGTPASFAGPGSQGFGNIPTQEDTAKKYRAGPPPPAGGMAGVTNSIDKMLFKALGVKKRVTR